MERFEERDSRRQNQRTPSFKSTPFCAFLLGSLHTLLSLPFCIRISMSNTAPSTDNAVEEAPYQPMFMDSLTLARDQRRGHTPLDSPQYMPPKEKMRLLLTTQPLIPIGLTATVGFFVYGLAHFVTGKAIQNNWKYVFSLSLSLPQIPLILAYPSSFSLKIPLSSDTLALCVSLN